MLDKFPTNLLGSSSIKTLFLLKLVLETKVTKMFVSISIIFLLKVNRVTFQMRLIEQFDFPVLLKVNGAGSPLRISKRSLLKVKVTVLIENSCEQLTDETLSHSRSAQNQRERYTNESKCCSIDIRWVDSLTGSQRDTFHHQTQSDRETASMKVNGTTVT